MSFHNVKKTNRTGSWVLETGETVIQLDGVHLDLPICLILLDVMHSDPTNGFPAPSRALLLSL